MASSLVDLVKINVSNSGAGAITLGSAVEGYRGRDVLTNGTVYSYSIQQGSAWEFGRGTYLAESAQLIRSVIDSSDGGTALDLKPNAQIAFTALSADLMPQVQVTELVQQGLDAAEELAGAEENAAESAALAGQYANADTDADIPGAPAGERGALYWVGRANAVANAATDADIPGFSPGTRSSLWWAGRSAAIANADTDEDVPGFAPGQRGAKFYADDAEARGGAQVTLATAQRQLVTTVLDTLRDELAYVDTADLTANWLPDVVSQNGYIISGTRSDTGVRIGTNTGGSSGGTASAGLPQVLSLSGNGDSIMNEQGATTSAQAWFNIFAAALGVTSPLNTAISGTVLQNSADAGGSARASNGRDRFRTALLGSNLKQLVVIAYGFNDARYTGAPATFNVTAYENDYNEIVSGLIGSGFPANRIVIVAPYYITDTGLATGSTGFTGQTRSGFEAFVTAARQIAMDYGCWYHDAYAYMRDNGGSALIGADNIHPNDTGHAVIAEGVLTATIINTRLTATGLTQSSGGAGSLTVAWTAPPDAPSTYEAAYGNMATDVWSTPVTGIATATNTWTGLSAGTYRTKVRPVYADGTKGPWAVATSTVSVS